MPKPMPSRQVYITGIGIVSPAGCGRDATWETLLAGRPCVRRVTEIDLSGCATDFAGQVSGFDPPAGSESDDRICQFAIAAAVEAFDSAGIQTDDIHAFGPDRCRVSIGTSKGGILTFASIAQAFVGRGVIPVDMGPYLGNILPDAPARHVATRFGITGGMHTSVAACSTGTLAVIRAAQWIHDDKADLVICGSSDASLHPLWFGAFERMNVLAPEHPVRGPGFACRPFDRSRAGFAMGEGAAILVLESSQSVLSRGRAPIARISGYATGSDPAGLIQLTGDGSPLKRVIELTCAKAGRQPEDISCVHAHGTATLSNDLQEVRAIRQILSSRASDVPIVSIKGAIGHLLGAAGSVEIAAAALSCQDRKSPGTATLLEPDTDLGKLHLPVQSIDLPDLKAVLKTSLGFGGQLAAVIIEPI